MPYKPIVITGQPGSGKTTLLNALKSKGVRCVDEPARKIIAEQRQGRGRGTFDQDPALFVSLMLARFESDYNTAKQKNSLIIFDRGIPDFLAYADYYDLDSTAIWQTSNSKRYCDEVFYAPAWPEIYKQDSERTMTFTQAQRFGLRSFYMYEKAGYKMLELPKGSVKERVEFIAAKLKI